MIILFVLFVDFVSVAVTGNGVRPAAHVQTQERKGANSIELTPQTFALLAPFEMLFILFYVVLRLTCFRESNTFVRHSFTFNQSWKNY